MPDMLLYISRPREVGNLWIKCDLCDFAVAWCRQRKLDFEVRYAEDWGRDVLADSRTWHATSAYYFKHDEHPTSTPWLLHHPLRQIEFDHKDFQDMRSAP